MGLSERTVEIVETEGRAQPFAAWHKPSNGEWRIHYFAKTMAEMRTWAVGERVLILPAV